MSVNKKKLSHENLADKKDEEVLFASQKNPSVFDILVERYEEPFRNKTRSILGNREEVDDIVQETFLKIYMNSSKFKVQEGASFKSWGYKILVNTTFTYYQKLKKEGNAMAHLEPEFYEALPDPHSEEIPREFSDYVASILVRMPNILSRALKLHFLDGMPQKEIAAAEGVSISAIKTRIHRAKKEFKKIESRLNGQ